MDADHQFDDLERALLVAVGELSSEERWTDTEQASGRVVVLLREGGQSFTLYTTPPWFGLEPAVRRLDDLGLLTKHPGMASFTGPGQPAPTMDRLYLGPTEAGRAAAKVLQ